jgi:cytochrome c biogenesis protein CcmG/thiol:disulfide interchange protein DsbE
MARVKPWFSNRKSFGQEIARMRVKIATQMRLPITLSLLLVVAPTAFAKAPQAGQPAPAIVATTLDGSRFELSEQRGKVVLVNFWATWCLPCRAEMPAIDAFYKAHRNEGLVVIAISMDEAADLALVRQAMSGFSFPTALISHTQAKGYGRLWRMPLTFVVDRDGILRRNAWKAAPKIDAASLDSEVLPLLRKPGA